MATVAKVRLLGRRSSWVSVMVEMSWCRTDPRFQQTQRRQHGLGSGHRLSVLRRRPGRGRGVPGPGTPSVRGEFLALVLVQPDTAFMHLG